MKKMKQVLGVIIFLGFLVTLSTPVFAGSANTSPSEDTVAFAPEKLYLGQEEGADTITVFGFGSSRGTAEEAQVSLGLTSFAPRAGTALKQHQLLLDKIAGHLQGKGIVPENITTLYFNVWPEYTYGDDTFQEPEIIGYRVNSTISVYVTDTLLVPEVIETGLAAGANRLEGIRYFAPRGLKQEALAAALKDGLAQARSLATVLDRRLGRLLSIDQSVSPPYELWEERTLTDASGIQPQDLEVNRCLCLIFCLK